MSKLISVVIFLFIIMDSFGNLPIFMSILKHLKPGRRRIIIIREMLFALFLMLIFLFVGEKFLLFLNIRPETVSISGSIILFLIAMQMIFPSQTGIVGINLSITNEEPFLIPLAVPLVAGPSILAALMLLSRQYSNHMKDLVLILFISWILSVIVLMLSNFFLYLLGDKGINVLERIMGLLLIMISTQMFLDGIHSFLYV